MVRKLEHVSKSIDTMEIPSEPSALEAPIFIVPLDQEMWESEEIAKVRRHMKDVRVTPFTESRRRMETAEEETDPSEYDNVVSINNTSVPEVYRTESHAMAVGEVKIIESDNYYYVVEKLELDPDGSELTARKSSLLQEMKSDEFDAMVQEWIAALPELTVNEKTIEEFSPEVIGKRQNG